jgi:hypothetical protein
MKLTLIVLLSLFAQSKQPPYCDNLVRGPRNIAHGYACYFATGPCDAPHDENRQAMGARCKKYCDPDRCLCKPMNCS